MLRFVEVKGKDSEDFLQRVTAGTVKGIGVGEGRAGLLLNGQSRMLAQFELLRTERERYLLAAPEGCASALADALEALHFSENLEIGLLGLKAGVLKAEKRREEQGSFPFQKTGDGYVWPAPVPGFAFSTFTAETPADWEFARIGALVPWPAQDWDANTPALEAGMLPWIDRDKGCYPGQEVVELSLNVGHPARVLVAVETNQQLQAGEKTPWDGTEAIVTSAAFANGKTRALLRLPWGKKDSLPTGFTRIRSHW
ncbi:MAG TPA: hypothetical protein VIH99_08260 [Bdellovibrionota bacterium]|jgi:folate-binding protein YgfZ